MHMQRISAAMVILALVSACAPASVSSPAPGGEEAHPADLTAASSASTSSATPDRPLAALVNGQPVYLVDYERQVAQYQATLAATGVDLSSEEGQQRVLQAREQILNYMIEQVLTEQAAAEMGIVVSDEDVDAALAAIVEDIGGEEAFQARLDQNGMTRQDVWNEQRAELIGAAVIEQIIGSVPESAEHVHARHILVDTRDEAEQLLTQLRTGADFAELARTHSQDESTRGVGGDLGWFPRGVLLAPEVEEAAFSLQAGQIGPVIESFFGFHLVQVIEREPDRALNQDNLQLLRDRAMQVWMEALWANAAVERFVNQSS
jgi:parvulin-like peptidyl-prolyl isomerase